MTIKSAREQLERRNDKNDTRRPNICMPLTIDSMLPLSSLPDEYYDLWLECVNNPNGSYTDAISYTLKEFFGTEPLPDTDLAAVAKFNAFGASPQSYMPDAPYNYPDTKEYFIKGGVTPQQLRFVKLLEIARDNGCNILFTNNSNGGGEHVSGLHMIDEGEEPLSAAYVIRDFVEIQGDTIYRPSWLAGIPQTLGNAEVTEFGPLPTVRRSYFPEGQASYELTIFPADPKL